MSVFNKIQSVFSRLALFTVTVRYLRPIQLFFQVYYRIKSAPKLKEINDVSIVTGTSIPWLSYHKSSTEDGLNFDFLGKTGTLNRSWSFEGYDKLWIYNLHYLNDVAILNGEKSCAFSQKLINCWIDGNSQGLGVGWEPYPISIRIVNILKFYTFNRSLSPNTSLVENLAQQADVLTHRLEYHILANHLFVNGKALVFAGCCLTTSEAPRWLKKGLDILDSELPEQFLADGGHFELSPMYHSALIWDLCELVLLARSSSNSQLLKRVGDWEAIITRGIRWLRTMVHPDREISFFNDAAFGIAPTLEQLEAYCRLLECLPETEKNEYSNNWFDKHLEDSGYITVSSEAEGHHAIMDVANIGPDYQPGHAHADTLSFELSLFGQRLFVNSGTSQYGTGLERDYQRGTAAHNTVMVDGADSSEVWAGFRVAKRAKPFGINIENKAGTVSVTASHNGYSNGIKKSPVKRTWVFLTDSILISDCVEGAFNNAVSRFYCHPEVEVSQTHTGLELTMPSGQKIYMRISGAETIQIEESNWHPKFGVSVPNKCIELVLTQGILEIALSW